MENFIRKSISLTIDNNEYLNVKCAQRGDNNVSSLINEIIRERRMNEQFDNCQSEF